MSNPIYSCLAGDEDIGEIVVLYAEEMPDRAARLRAELDARNWEALQHFVHQLKGSAGSHGFTVVSETAAKLNALLKSGQPEEMIVATTLQLIDLCHRVTGEAEPSSAVLTESFGIPLASPGRGLG